MDLLRHIKDALTQICILYLSNQDGVQWQKSKYSKNESLLEDMLIKRNDKPTNLKSFPDERLQTRKYTPLNKPRKSSPLVQYLKSTMNLGYKYATNKLKKASPRIRKKINPLYIAENSIKMAKERFLGFYLLLPPIADPRREAYVNML